MEETKNANKPLSYEELKAAFNDLSMQYQKLVGQYQQALRTINGFDSTSFILNAMFKVMEHPELYKDGFVGWVAENIEGALTTLAQNINASSEEKEESKDEAK